MASACGVTLGESQGRTGREGRKAGRQEGKKGATAGRQEGKKGTTAGRQEGKKGTAGGQDGQARPAAARTVARRLRRRFLPQPVVLEPLAQRALLEFARG